MSDSLTSSLNSRQEDIRRRLADRGRLSVEALARELDVTTMTVRRDLSALERAGLLTRTHGGCVLHTPFVTDLSFSEKMTSNQAQKRAIAREVVRLLVPGSSVYLDTGTTAMHVARSLPLDRRLRIFTNNLRVAMELFGRQGLEVFVYGGRLATRSPDLSGEAAVGAVGMFTTDIAVMGCDAIDPHTGTVYAAEIGGAAVARQAQKLSSHVIVAADHSKIGRRASAVVGRLGKGITLVTDQGVSGADLQRLRSTNARVIVAKVAQMPANPSTHEAQENA